MSASGFHTRCDGDKRNHSSPKTIEPPIGLSPQEARELTLKSLVPGDMFADQVIKVGVKVYTLHKSIICSQSAYFQN
ncbi:hypothetical protein TWF481_003151 [Arthrobotrys musiformis]|uniref:BTB domain-containing protein n=1 Tax=Arthrobotrys musiformis TaxID=47236 RepID=A0AAV9VR89_9PEZI